MKCPYCSRPCRIPEHAERNMESYRNTCNVVTLCCGNIVHASPVFSFSVDKSNATTDDWGETVRLKSNPTAQPPNKMSNDTKPLVSDEKREELRREMTIMMYPSNPDMGGREFYRIGMGHQRRIDRAIDYMLEAQAAELARYRSLAQVLVDATGELAKLKDYKIHIVQCEAVDMIPDPDKVEYYLLNRDRAWTELRAALAKAKEGFDLTPTNQ